MSYNLPLLIIVPTLNTYKVLPRLIKSLKSQTFQEWRLLFVDGPSTNEHMNWLKKSCEEDNRINFIKQNNKNKGIYGAMNQGLEFANKEDWVLFWGSDDWAFSRDTLANIINLLSKHHNYNSESLPDLIIARGTYIDSANGMQKRVSRFDETKNFFDNLAYKKAMFFGSTPPHQATLIGPGARNREPLYSNDFYLTADLDFFLSLINKKNLKVLIMREVIVNMEDSGVSSQYIKLRIYEVLSTYFKHFKIYFIIPFLARYIKKIISKFFK